MTRLHSSAFLLANHDVNARQYPLRRTPQSSSLPFCTAHSVAPKTREPNALKGGPSLFEVAPQKRNLIAELMGIDGLLSELLAESFVGGFGHCSMRRQL